MIVVYSCNLRWRKLKFRWDTEEINLAIMDLNPLKFYCNLDVFSSYEKIRIAASVAWNLLDLGN
jgi:hypothetical protein